MSDMALPKKKLKRTHVKKVKRDPAKEALLEKGFVELENHNIGYHLQEFRFQGFHLLSLAGLEFVQKHILDNPSVRSMADAFFDGKRCVLTHYSEYGAFPCHVECFIPGGEQTGRRALMIQLLSRGARVDYFSYSQQYNFPMEMGPRDTMEVYRPDIFNQGCEQHVMGYDAQGGIVAVDARLAHEMWAGRVVTVVLLAEDSAYGVAPMLLPGYPGVREKVIEMQSEKIVTNFGISGYYPLDGPTMHM